MRSQQIFAFLPAKIVFVGIKPSQVLSTAVNFASSTLVRFSQTVRRYPIIPLGSERHCESNCLAEEEGIGTKQESTQSDLQTVPFSPTFEQDCVRPPAIHPDNEITHDTHQRLPCCLEILLTDFKLCIQ